MKKLKHTYKLIGKTLERILNNNYEYVTRWLYKKNYIYHTFWL
mgnify:CR=1 FL=1